jgi:hypothetical protein
MRHAAVSQRVSAKEPTCHNISHLHLDPVTMPPPKLPLEILLMIARLLTDHKGELCFADFNSFLKINRALYACLNRTFWREAANFDSITDRVLTYLPEPLDNNHLITWSGKINFPLG